MEDKLAYQSEDKNTKPREGAGVWSPRAISITQGIAVICLALGLAAGVGGAAYFYMKELESARQSVTEKEAEIGRLNGTIENMRVEQLRVTRVAMERGVKIEALTVELRGKTAQLEEERRKSAVLAEKAKSLQARLALAQSEAERLARWSPKPFQQGGELLPVGVVSPKGELGTSLAGIVEPSTPWYELLAIVLALALTLLTGGIFLGVRLRGYANPRRR